MDSFETICKNATNEWLEKYKTIYEDLINYHTSDGKIYNKKVDKMVDPGRMPWMVKVYQSGLKIVTNELNTRRQNSKGGL